MTQPKHQTGLGNIFSVWPIEGYQPTPMKSLIYVGKSIFISVKRHHVPSDGWIVMNRTFNPGQKYSSI